MICLKLASCLDMKTNVFVHQYVPLAQYKGSWHKYLQNFLKNYQILVINNLDKYVGGKNTCWCLRIHKLTIYQGNSLISLQHSLLTFNTPYRTFIRLHGSNMAFYLYREPSAIYAVFWACWSITLAPVKLHLLSLKAPWQSSPCYKVLILQEYSNWRKKEKR